MNLAMKLLGLVSLAAILLLAAPGCGACRCTLRYCAEGIFVTIPPIDGSEISEQELYWVDDAGELVPAVQGDGVGSSTWRIDLYDLPGQVESIQLQLIDDDGAVPIQDEYPVQWISSVCNRCSGRPSCSDELAHTANIEVVLD